MGSHILEAGEAHMIGNKVYDKSVLQMMRYDLQKIVDAMDYSRKVND